MTAAFEADTRRVTPDHQMAHSRATLFRETFAETLERIALGTAWTLQPSRIGGMPALGRLWLENLVAPQRQLLDPHRPLNAGGLCGLVKNPSASTVVEGYRHGLFTFAHYGPLKWVSLPERNVLFFDNFHVATNVRPSCGRTATPSPSTATSRV